MMIFKRKQIVVLSLVLMVLFAGYLQYNYKQSSISVNGKENGKLGEAVYVESTDVKETEKQKEDKKDGKSDSKSEKKTQSVTASKEANDFFAQAKIDKEMTRGKDKDSLKEITKDKEATKEAKAKAYEKMMKIVDQSEKEMKVETLIKQKGFKDAIALFGDDGSLDIVIKTQSLSQAQTAQIADIVSRQANVDINNIHIKNMF
ncbi:MAG: SpoIIIAH-like family protein [Clostridia bacterium]|nr:SpoIIIAH-like family protein [Clostridia bacterium]